MANNLEYPLEQVLDIKKRRVDEAERVVKKKEEALEAEKEKLRQAEEERDKVLQHQQDKLNQLREELDHMTTSPKIQQMKVYLEVVKDRLEIEEKKVEEQKEQVKVAEENLEAARQELFLRRQEVDKIENHRKDWIKEMLQELAIIEGREMDEIGTITYMTRKRMYE